MEKMTGESLNLTQENINRLKELFPEILTENKIDFEKLRLILGDEVETSPERYEFRWNGKSEAIKLSQTPSMGTLRPDKESSKNWDKTENLYIEGDNLEVLKLLQKSYFGKIKMIYIDPPYNTGKDFVYKDNFHDNIANYKEITNQSTKANAETNGRFHTDWLNMMYPRLRLARNLLKDDGVIFISIDEAEIENLKKICNEIFGDMNFISNVIWKKKVFDNNDNFPPLHEYLLIYAKNKDYSFFNLLPRSEEQLSKYKNPDNDPKGPYYFEKLSVNTAGGRYSKATDFEIINPDTNEAYRSPTGNWRFGKDTINEMIKSGRIDFSASLPRYRVYLSEVKQGVSANTWWDDCGQNLHAAKEIKEIFGAKYFDTPKPTEYIKRMIYLATSSSKNDIVLDFFSGSATTADTVMKLNLDDNGNRKYILVQLPENLNADSEAYKAGYNNICEIGKERIRRSGDKLLNDINNKDLDIGFKVFKLDDSNIKTWDSNTKDLENTIFNSTENLKDDRTQEDLLYELMLKLGIELTSNIEEIYVGDKKIYNIHSGGLVICIENEITKDVIEYIPTLKSPFMEMKVVFKEYGFITDSDKLNAIQNLKQHGIIDVRSV